MKKIVKFGCLGVDYISTDSDDIDNGILITYDFKYIKWIGT
jgi:hypothetical protein